MDGYDAVTFDEHKVGHVVGRSGPFIVVEHGTIFKHRRPVPETFATVDDNERVVRLTVSKGSRVGPGGGGQRARRARRRQAAGSDPSEVGTDDRLEGMPSDRDELEQMERAERMTHLGRGRGPDDTPLPSPGATGGDRSRDAG